jgi:signal transduction histidine kinase
MINDLSIRIKIILAQIVVVALVSVFIYSYYPSQQKQAALEAVESKIHSISNMFSIGVGIGMGETDLVAVSEALNWANADSSVVYLSVRNTNEQKIASFTASGMTLPDETTGVSVKGKLILIDKIIYYKTDITYQSLTFGSLLIGYSIKKIEDDISHLKLTTLYFCLILFAVGVLLSIVIGNMMTENIRELDNTVRIISSGAEHVRVTVTSNDEIGELGRAFNKMLHRLDKSRNELIRYSEQLKKQNEELNQFSYVVSHDLKAPLRAIFKLSEWIEEDSNEVISDESRKNMQTLRGRVFRMESLINGLLEYSKIGRKNIPYEKVDVKTMLKENIDLLNPPPHIEITIECDLPVIKTKKILLQQVFINLISNAIKYNDKSNGVIVIKAHDHDSHYQFSIEDNGPGIAAEYHKKVFEIFQTLESRDKVEGTGIGLSIIKKCVEDMDGTITLKSVEGAGALFTFTWGKEENITITENQNVTN